MPQGETMTALQKAAICALAELIGLADAFGTTHATDQTITELYRALVDEDVDVSAYEEEYIEAAAESDMSVDEFVRDQEGTYNHENGHLLCTDCYIKAGMPAVPYPGRWVAP